MDILDAFAVLPALAAIFGIINHKFLKLPFAIGLLVSGLLASLCVVIVDAAVPTLQLSERVATAVTDLNFADTVLSGMLSVLLFAGALHTDISRLRERRSAIVMLASVGVVISTVVTGVISYGAFQLVGLDIDWIWCFAFGALISPTDPIAVLGIMKSANAPQALETKVIGESLFNDGTGVVLFTLLSGVGVALATGDSGAAHEASSAGTVAALLAKEILGGVALGLAMGYLGILGLRSVDETNLEMLISVAIVMCLNLIALKLHVSAPLAAVAAGLVMGTGGHAHMTKETAHAYDTIWTFIDETLNAVLFLLIGFVVFAIDTRTAYLYGGLIIIPTVLAARFAGVFIPVMLLQLRREIDRGTVAVLTWGGLKGGVSVALAMKLPDFPGRTAVLTVTYIVVVFSIVVQGLTVGKLIRRLYPKTALAEPPPG